MRDVGFRVMSNRGPAAAGDAGPPLRRGSCIGKASSFRTAATRCLSMLLAIRAPSQLIDGAEATLQIGGGINGRLTYVQIGIRVRCSCPIRSTARSQNLLSRCRLPIERSSQYATTNMSKMTISAGDTLRAARTCSLGGPLPYRRPRSRGDRGWRQWRQSC